MQCTIPSLIINAMLEHKVQSSVLQQDLAALIEQKEEIEKQRIAMLKETARGGVVKKSNIRCTILVSAIQDGKINIAHAKRSEGLTRSSRECSLGPRKRDHLVITEQS